MSSGRISTSGNASRNRTTTTDGSKQQTILLSQPKPVTCAEIKYMDSLDDYSSALPPSTSVSILLDQILRVSQFLVVEVHVPLSRADVRVPQQPAGVFDALLTANLRTAFVPGQVEHQIFGQPCIVSQPSVRSAEVLDAP